jgi:cytochrome c-type biogenesis protein CcmH/NrfF
MVLGDPQDQTGETWAVRTYVKPFANWIWGGAVVMALGGVLSLTDRRYRVGAPPACRNESIDDSNADFARTMRLLVRERVTAGDSNDEVLDFIVDRYGEYALLTPRFTIANALIWLAGPLLLVMGGWLAWRYTAERHRAAAAGADAPAPLSAEEEARLAELLKH